MNFGIFFCLFVSQIVQAKDEIRKNKQPNILFILADDVGFGDLQSYGHPTQEYGAIDEIAKNGIKFTGFSVPESVCTPSRTAFLTGRLPQRVGMYSGNHRVPRMLMPFSKGGLPRDEIILPQVLQKLGYVTGMVGKWHLGINNDTNYDGNHLPMHYGFDFVGYHIPFTNNFRCDLSRFNTTMSAEGCFLYRGKQNVQQPTQMELLTSKLEEDAISFISSGKHVQEKKPWFFFMSMPQTHTAVFCNEKYCGKSKRGAYGDMMNEMHGAVDRVINEIKKNKEQYENTLILFSSDHGPLRYGCANGGEAGPFRGGKADTWEGGLRVPLVASWPKMIKPGQLSSAYLSTMDLFPSLVEIAGGNSELIKDTLPTGRKIDGVSIVPQLLGSSHENSHENLFYFCGSRLFAMRHGKFKIHFCTKKQEHYHEDVLITTCFSWDYRVVLKRFSCFDPETVKCYEKPLLYNTDANVNEDVLLEWEDYPGLYDNIIRAKDAFMEELELAPSRHVNLDRKYTPCCSGIPGSCDCDKIKCKGNECGSL